MHEGYRRQTTEGRQRDDIRQTDDRRTDATYSKREDEFTFAKKEHTQHCTILPHRQTRKREKLSRYWSETSAAEVQTYFSAISSNRGRAHSLINIVDIDIDTDILLSTGWLKKVSCCTVSIAYFF